MHQGEQVLPSNIPFLNVTTPYTTDVANYYASSVILDAPPIPLTYTIFDPEADLVGQVKAFYSLNGSGHWQPAVATTDTITLSSGTASTGARR